MSNDGTFQPPGVEVSFEPDSDRGNISDGHHTFDELYEHRHLLFLALARSHGGAWVARKHADGSIMDGWFIAGMSLDGMDITYHLPDRLWPLVERMDMKVVPHAPEWDGHDGDEVLARLWLFADADPEC